MGGKDLKENTSYEVSV